MICFHKPNFRTRIVQPEPNQMTFMSISFFLSPFFYNTLSQSFELCGRHVTQMHVKLSPGSCVIPHETYGHAR